MALACHTGFNRFSQARATRRSAFHTTSMTRKNTLRWITIALGLVALGVVAKWQFFPAAQPPSFVTATATTTDLQDTVLATGVLQAFKQVSVGAQVSGQVKVLHVALGDKVKAGQLIAEIDSVPQQNTQRNAEAALANVQAQLRAQQATHAQTALALQRQKELFAADAGARADLESAQAANDLALANVDGLKAQILQAQVTVDTAKVNMGYTRIVAPIDGQVVAIVTQQGQTVNANQSTPTIIKLAQTETMTVKTQISEADVTRVKIGQKVYFTILRARQALHRHAALHRARARLDPDRHHHVHHQQHDQHRHLLQRPVRRTQPRWQAAHLDDRASADRAGRRPRRADHPRHRPGPTRQGRQLHRAGGGRRRPGPATQHQGGAEHQRVGAGA